MLFREEKPSLGCHQAQPSLFLFLFLSLAGRMPRMVEGQEKPPPGWEQLSEQWGHKTVKDCGVLPAGRGGAKTKSLQHQLGKTWGKKPGRLGSAVLKMLALWQSGCNCTF